MTVADLIDVFKPHVPAAIVVLCNQTPHGGKLSKLGVGEVQTIQLGAGESNALLLIDAWVVGSDELQGPFPEVVLGSN